MPISRHARMTRTAISPRFAMRILFRASYSIGPNRGGRSKLRPTAPSLQAGWTPVVRRLLVGVGKADERRLAPRAAEELKARRERAVRVAHRDCYRRESRARRKELVVVAARRVEIAD